MRLAYWEVLIALRSGGIRIALLVFSILLFVALALGAVSYTHLTLPTILLV